MEILLLCFLAAWALTRYGITDAISASKGTESPRVGERRQRSAEAHERAMARTGPTIGEAIAGRIADRIQHPPPSKSGAPRGQTRGPARQYAADLWGDSWRRAGDQRRARQEHREAQRRAPEQTGPEQQTGTGPEQTGPEQTSPEQTGPDSGPEQAVPDPEAGGGRVADGGRGPQERGNPDEGWRWRHEDPAANRTAPDPDQAGPAEQAVPDPGSPSGDPAGHTNPGSGQGPRSGGPAGGGGPRTGHQGGQAGARRGRVEDPIVDGEIVDPDVAPDEPDGPSDPVVVDGEVVDAEVVDAEVVDDVDEAPHGEQPGHYSGDSDERIERMRREAAARRHAGMRFANPDGTWIDAMGRPADPPAPDGSGFAERRLADLRRWGLDDDQPSLPAAATTSATTSTNGTTSTNTTSTNTGDAMASVTPIRKGIPMTSATTHEMGSGEVLNPSDGLRFVEGTAEMMRALDTSVETAISNLAEAGVAGDPIDQLSQIREAVLTVIGSCETAQAHFERHIGTQDQIHGDDTVAGTVTDTYLGRQA